MTSVSKLGVLLARLAGCYAITMIFLATTSRAGMAGVGAEEKNQRHLLALSVTGITAEEVCKSFLETYYGNIETQEMFRTSCVCEGAPSSSGFSIDCSDKCENCLGAECSWFTISAESTKVVNGEVDIQRIELCDNFNENSYGGSQLCQREIYDDGVYSLDYTVNGEACADNSKIVTCIVDGEETSGELVDCSNLVEGTEEMNFCDWTTGIPETSPFHYWAKRLGKDSEYTVRVGDCSDATPLFLRLWLGVIPFFINAGLVF